MGRFTNQGLMRAEGLFTGAHPRAGQYLDQAPILVMWALPWADYRHQSGETFAGIWIADKCEKGVPLKTFLRDAGFPAPLRMLKASVLQPGHAGVYRMLARVPAPVLGRCIPTTAKAQRAWLRALCAWCDTKRNRLTLDNDALFRWCAEHFSDAIKPEQAKDLLDFQLGCRTFNTAWGLKRAREEMEAWHARITLESQLRGLPVGPDERIDLGDHPDTWTCDTYVVRPLRTPREIAEEGSAMRHCVATYIKAVFDGRSYIASITREGRRVATLELGGPKAADRRYAVVQLKGPRNSEVAPAVKSLALLYSALLRDRSQGKAA